MPQGSLLELQHLVRHALLRLGSWESTRTMRTRPQFLSLANGTQARLTDSMHGRTP